MRTSRLSRWLTCIRVPGFRQRGGPRAGGDDNHVDRVVRARPSGDFRRHRDRGRSRWPAAWPGPTPPKTQRRTLNDRPTDRGREDRRWHDEAEQGNGPDAWVRKAQNEGRQEQGQAPVVEEEAVR